ncbi:hypothetical protein [Terriglobus sp.]|uniref:hypothetical protein n=1 Tax=Terriglobus sp. TaxID=1889013 RepID=UPI003AFF6ABB
MRVPAPLLLILPISLAALPALAQQATRAVPSARFAHASPATAEASQSLPIRRVALYKNGVGFFEHAGTVRGDQAVTIDFTTAQLNDVLQTLTAIDLGGGRIQGAGYNSTTPLDQQLKALPLALAADPTATDLYTAIRGARVEITGDGSAFSGRILNVEIRETATPKPANSDASSTPTLQRQYLTVVSDTGVVRTFELTDRTAVRLLDRSVQGGLERYLQTLAANHQDGLRHLTLTDSGSAAPRELRVSYISEVPVWKCTYRLLFDNKTAGTSTAAQTATLQGWAVVDNTVGTDWDNVQLSLIAGAPQSFIQPISQPTYTRRPEIALPQEAQLTPQTHESGDAASTGVTGAGMGTGNGSGMGYGSGSGIGPGFDSGASRAAIPKSSQSVMVTNGSIAGPVRRDRLAVLAAPPPAPSPSYEEAASASITPQTTTGSFDDYFEYKLTEPVTIRKNESALVPILQAKVDVDPVTLWSPSEPQPLRALWVRNTSGLTLDRGSFSILENGNFSGQGLLDPIHPGERRLLSYAADQAIRVTPNTSQRPNNQPRHVQQITIARGVLTVKSAEVSDQNWLVHNAAPEPRTVVVEQPKLTGYTLAAGTQPEETTAGSYRFRVAVAPGATTPLHVSQHRTLDTRYQLANIDSDQILLILRQDGDPPAVMAALQPVLAAKRHLSDLDGQAAQHEFRIAEITTDQNRLRSNLQALKGTAEERALAKRYTDELNKQEDQLAQLRTELDSLREQQQAARDALAAQLESLQVDVSL